MPSSDLGFLRDKASEMMRHLVCALLDGLFLVLWAVPNVYVGRLIETLHVTGTIDQIVLRCMQGLFGVSTIAPIFIWTYKDVRIMARHASREIEDAGIATADPGAHK
jgi:hypothetical protein